MIVYLLRKTLLTAFQVVFWGTGVLALAAGLLGGGLSIFAFVRLPDIGLSWAWSSFSDTLASLVGGNVWLAKMCYFLAMDELFGLIVHFTGLWIGIRLVLWTSQYLIQFWTWQVYWIFWIFWRLLIPIRRIYASLVG